MEYAERLPGAKLVDSEPVTGKQVKDAFKQHVEDSHAGKTKEEIHILLEEHEESQATLKWMIEFLFGTVIKNPVTNERSFDNTGVLADFAIARDRGERPQIVVSNAKFEPSASMKWMIGIGVVAFVAVLSMVIWAAVVVITGLPIAPPGVG